MDVQIPNLPDVAGEAAKDMQLRDFLIAVKNTLEILTGASVNSNKALIDLLNDNQ
jgi:hypothetical protein